MKDSSPATRFAAALLVLTLGGSVLTLNKIDSLRGPQATLEEVLEHYKQFYIRVQIQNPAAPLLTTQPGVTPPVIDRPFTDAEIPALLAYLRRL